MALTAKTVSTTRNTVGKAQVFRGDGDESGYAPGSGRSFRVAVGEYNFAEDGALAADAIFGTGVFVPANSVVVRAGLFTETDVTGAPNIGATLYGAMVAATASADFNLVADATVTTVDHTSVIGVPVSATASTWLHTGALPREILIDFTGGTGAATTAGRVFVWVEYITLVNATPAT